MNAVADPPPGRASLLTPPGRGAVAVIAAEGPAAVAAVEAHFRAANRLRLRDQPLNRIVFGHWIEQHSAGMSSTTSPARAASREEVVLCRTHADGVEIHCHGGVAAAERILRAFGAAGCAITPWRERLAHQRPAKTIAWEAEIALASAGTLRTAAILLDQLHGALASEIRLIQSAIADATDESTAEASQRLAALLDRRSVGLHLAQPWRMAIAGRPNVGKSSLLNALAGYQRAIVFDQPGTTRDVLSVEAAIDGWPVQLADAAGLRCPADELEAAGIALAKERIVLADLVVWVLDAAALSPADLSDPYAAAERQIVAELGEYPVSWLAVVNKRDLAAGPIGRDAAATCALTGAGLDDVLRRISHRLVPRPPEEGAAVPFTERQVAVLQTMARRLNERDLAAAQRALLSIFRSRPLEGEGLGGVECSVHAGLLASNPRAARVLTSTPLPSEGAGAGTDR